jgi:hypothetical protein
LVEAKGIDEAVMLKALNIEKPIWDEVNSLWINRISNDKKREVLNLWMNYQNEEIDHPVLLSLLNIKPTSDYGEKLCEDYFFYNELNAIMAASEKCGMDTMHFIKEKFGLTQYDLQKSSIEWGSRDFEITSKMKFEGFNYYEQKYKEWYEVFSKDLGGNIADEVTF